MHLPLEIRPEVLSDVQRIRRRYERERRGLGERFLKVLREAYLKISAYPSGPALIFRDVRVRDIRRFPYGVYYRIRSDHVEILAVVHLHRNDRIWKRRLDD